jgi:hypothetical protein
MFKVFDHVHGATTFSSRVSAPLAKLLASADLVAPPTDMKFDIKVLDAKLAGLPLDQRFKIKSALSQAGML